MRRLIWLCLLGGLTLSGQSPTAYGLKASGPGKGWAGYELWYIVDAVYDQAPSNRNGWIVFEPANLPAGFTASWRCDSSRPTCTTYYNERRQYVSFQLKIAIDASVQPGDYTLTLSTHRDVAPDDHVTLTIPVRVEQAVFQPTPPSAVPPLPRREAWEKAMRDGGNKLCTPPLPGFLFSVAGESLPGNQSSWYYDGTHVFLSLHDYLGEEKYLTCATQVADQWSAWVNGNNTLRPWEVFTQGLQELYGRTSNEAYRAAVHKIATASPAAVAGGDPDPSAIRETAYALSAYLDDYLVDGDDHTERINRAVSCLIGAFHMTGVEGSRQFVQPFMNGLATESLIRYYEYSCAKGACDARIPETVKLWLDWWWNRLRDYYGQATLYSLGVSPASWYNNLDGMILPAAGWYYSVTGDQTVLRRGDEIFSHLTNSDVTWRGKEFNQAFRWMFDFARKYRVPTAGQIGVLVPEAFTATSPNTITVMAPDKGRPGICSEAVRLTSSNEEALRSFSVRVPEGKVESSGKATAAPVTGTVPVSLQATWRSTCIRDPYRPARGEQITVPAAVAPDRLRVSITYPAWLGGPMPNNRVTVDGMAPQGLAISLGTDRPDLVLFTTLDGTARDGVTIPAGAQQSEAFVIQALPVDSATAVQITATAVNGLTGSAVLTLKPGGLKVALPRGSNTILGFTYPNNQVILPAPAGLGGVAVKMLPPDAYTAIEPNPVIVPEGKTVGLFTMVVGKTNPGTNYPLVAFTPDLMLGVTDGITHDGPPAITLTMPATAPRSTAVPAKLNVTGGGAAPLDMVYNLVATEGATVPASVTIPEGARSAAFTVRTGPAAASVTITATPANVTSTPALQGRISVQ